MVADRGRVDSDLLPQVWQEGLEPAGDLDETGFDKVGVVGQAPNEAVEGRAVGNGAGEPAEEPEDWVVGKAADQGVGVGEIEDERGDVGLPEGQERIVLASGGAVRRRLRRAASSRMSKTAASSPKMPCTGRNGRDRVATATWNSPSMWSPREALYFTVARVVRTGPLALTTLYFVPGLYLLRHELDTNRCHLWGYITLYARRIEC